MTVRRRNPTKPMDRGVLEEVNMTKGTITFRGLLMLGVFLATTPGQRVFNALTGMSPPPNEALKDMPNEWDKISKEFAAFRAEFRQEQQQTQVALQVVKDSQAEQKSEMKALSVRFDGFHNDLETIKKRNATGSNPAPL